MKRLLNHLTKFKGFVFQNEKIDQDNNEILVEVVPRKNSKGICSYCGNKGATYDHLPERRFYLPPIWSCALVLLYSMRRINCQHCQRVIVERTPWNKGKSPITQQFSLFLSNWAKRLSWKEVADIFHVTWRNVADAVQLVVNWGLKHRQIDNLNIIGVDEVQRAKGHQYFTLVYQIDALCKRLLWIGEGRKKEVLSEFFHFLGDEKCQNIKFVCSDMWKGFISAIAEHLPHAIHILDKFHIVQNLNKAVDLTRRDEVQQLKRNGQPAYLKKSRWIFLHKLENLPESGFISLQQLLQLNLITTKAFFLKELFDQLWKYETAYDAQKFMHMWIKEVDQIEELKFLKNFSRSLLRHEELILNYFRTGKMLSSGIVEGLNNKVKVTLRKSYGFRTQKYQKCALYHVVGKLPIPEETHKFC